MTWDPDPESLRYDVVRGEVAGLQISGATVDLGSVVCIEDDSPDNHTRGFEDAAQPAPGQSYRPALEVDLPAGLELERALDDDESLRRHIGIGGLGRPPVRPGSSGGRARSVGGDAVSTLGAELVRSPPRPVPILGDLACALTSDSA